MNILFFHTIHSKPSMIFEMQTEIILKHLEAEDNVTIVVDFEEVMNSQAWYLEVKAQKYIYNVFFKKMMNLFENYQEQVSVVGYHLTAKEVFPEFTNIDELKKYTYKNINIGRGVASFLITKYREHIIDTKKFKKDISRELNVASKVLNTIEYYTDRVSPNLVYVFNGRVSASAPVVLYCEKNKLIYKVFEFTFKGNKYHIVNNTIPHDTTYRRNEMLSLWNNNLPRNQKENIAKSFFERSRKSGFFLAYQKENGKLGIDESKEIITFFNSSMDEFASASGWEKPVYIFQDEVDAINSICNYYKNDSTKQFVLRIHPNLQFLVNTQTKSLESLRENENLIIYDPESSVHSYQLIDISSKIITFGSTIGVEACYFQKPSVCLGISFYQNIDVSYNPKNEQELFMLLNDRELSPKPKGNSFIYGYWISTFGDEYIYKNKVYDENYYSLSPKQKVIVMMMKLFSLSLLKRMKLLFTSSFYKKLKNPRYRSGLVRTFFPWKRVKL